MLTSQQLCGTIDASMQLEVAMQDRFETFTVLIDKVKRCIRRIKTEEMSEYNLKSPHVSCLYYLYRHKDEPLTAKELSLVSVILYTFSPDSSVPKTVLFIWISSGNLGARITAASRLF